MSTKSPKVKTNTDGKNRKHKVGKAQSQGLSKAGAEKVVDGGQPDSSTDRAVMKKATEEKMFDITQDTVRNKMKTADRMHQQTMDMIRG